MVYVADELLFERILDALSPMDRASVDRVLASRESGSSVGLCEGCECDVVEADEEAAEQRGYDRGLAAGRAEKNTA